MSLVDWIYPVICVGCGRAGMYICQSCQRKLVKPEAICPVCGKPSLDGWTHSRCRSSYGIDRLYAGLAYPGVVQQCLKKVKYRSAWEIVSFLYQLCDFPAFDTGVVVPVPMWKPKERERGFNQAEMIATLLAKNYKDPIFVKLERMRATRPMFGLTRKARKENVKHAFRVTNQRTNRLMGQRIILVDDVWTTGATMRECAVVLKRAGAREVWGVTLAR